MDRTGVPEGSCRLPIDHLSPAQVALLRNVLNSHGTQYGLARDAVFVPPSLLLEARAAIEWVGIDAAKGDVFDDPEYRSERPPVVRPPRPPLHDGRNEASRSRRLCAGLIDEVIVGIPTILAFWSGAPGWTSAVMHAVYYTAPTTLFGWSIGKLWCGIRVVDRRSLDRPSPWQSLVRWLVAAFPLLLSLAGWLDGDALGAAVVLTYAPVAVNLRGVHDYAAGTVVAERSAAGPGVWKRRVAGR